MKFSEYVKVNGRPFVAEAGEYLFRQGDQDASIYILQSGLLKAYYLLESGTERIKSFILPGAKIGSLAANHAGEKCTFSLRCLKQSALVALSFPHLRDASQSDAALSAEMVDFLLTFGIGKELREYELLCLSAEERYKRLLTQTPEIFDLVTQNEIARYLGVTPVGLSRIKKRLV